MYASPSMRRSTPSLTKWVGERDHGFAAAMITVVRRRRSRWRSPLCGDGGQGFAAANPPCAATACGDRRAKPEAVQRPVASPTPGVAERAPCTVKV
ncbi:hypothetical protein P3T35_004033 [Kitasatospora sp. GP30]|nr:hypothetical protein [Kitasatospora sp. GP30]